MLTRERSCKSNPERQIQCQAAPTELNGVFRVIAINMQPLWGINITPQPKDGALPSRRYGDAEGISLLAGRSGGLHLRRG